MPNSKRIIARRRNLMAEDPHCYYCGTEVRYYPLGERETPPDDFATIDHVYSRNGGPRPLQGHQVLACYRCNQDLGTAEQQQVQQRRLTYKIGDVFGDLGEAV